MQASKNDAGVSKTLQYQPLLINSILLCFVGMYSLFSHELKVEQSTVAEGLGGQSQAAVSCILRKIFTSCRMKAAYLSLDCSAALLFLKVIVT